jgi:hypothetical protein
MSNIVPVEIVNDNICEVITPKVQRYVDDYIMYYTKCADAILSLAETCYDAKKNLDKSEFKQFTKEVHLDSSNATLSKYLKIGKTSTHRFRSIEDRLPSAWTVLYDLASLTNDEYKKVLPIISNDMTAKDIREVLGKTNNSVPLVVPDMTIDLSNKLTPRKREIYFELQQLAIKYKFTINLSKTFEDEVLHCDLKEVA